MTSALYRVYFHSVHDGYHALAVLNQIEKNMKDDGIENLDSYSNSGDRDRDTTLLFFKNRILIVLDSVSGCSLKKMWKAADIRIYCETLEDIYRNESGRGTHEVKKTSIRKITVFLE